MNPLCEMSTWELCTAHSVRESLHGESDTSQRVEIRAIRSATRHPRSRHQRRSTNDYQPLLMTRPSISGQVYRQNISHIKIYYSAKLRHHRHPAEHSCPQEYQKQSSSSIVRQHLALALLGLYLHSASLSPRTGRCVG